MISNILKWKRYAPFIISGVLICSFFLFHFDLNPWDRKTFISHDETQGARVSEFALNLQYGIIPPRISPNMSFGMGYPIFNYYAPFAYWVTSGLHLLGIPIIQSLELSYALALLLAYAGMALFLEKYLSKNASVVGGLLYITSPFIATEIFVRGNIAEMWFFALFPLSLALLQKVNKKNLFFISLIISFLFSVHNIFSLLSIGIVFTYAILIKNKFALFSILGGLLLSAYFLIPAIIELPLVHAQNVATLTNYKEHFICPLQLWYSPWGFGGSTAGCIHDGMSFMLGKLHLIMGFAGLGLLLFKIGTKRNVPNMTIMVSMAAFFIGSIFLATKYSESIWHIFERILALFQFPWRFLLITVFGLSFFGGYLISWLETHIAKKTRPVVIMLICFGIIAMTSKFFHGTMISDTEYNKRFLSLDYIQHVAAYKVAEYLPISADYNTWRLLENNTFPDASDIPKNNDDLFNRTISQEAGKEVIINIHNAQYWKITSGGEMLTPESYDAIGRPIIAKTDHNRKMSVTYHQTLVQQIANYIALLSGILLISYSYLWNKNQNTT